MKRLLPQLRLGRKHGVRFDARFVNLMVAMVVVQVGLFV